MYIDFPEDDNCVCESIRKHGPMTLTEIAKRMKISYGRVAQLQKQAIEKLKRHLGNNLD